MSRTTSIVGSWQGLVYARQAAARAVAHTHLTRVVTPTDATKLLLMHVGVGATLETCQ